ncbi:MAG: DUF4279 domain-containing protein [Alphaproteobacteria bacterium]|nr:DUF4279 domain-containing protein [Alphaproteobacteria bacterium]
MCSTRIRAVICQLSFQLRQTFPRTDSANRAAPCNRKSPTESHTKGDVITNKTTGSVRVAKAGSWLFEVERREPGDLDGQIKELFGALTQDLSAWRTLAAKYKPDLFVGMFMRCTGTAYIFTAGE